MLLPAIVSAKENSMDHARLKYFVSAAQCLNFTEVAKNNFISQPSVSHQISLLESELGVSLFIREGKRLRLTNEGEYCIRLVSEVLKQVQHDGYSIEN